MILQQIGALRELGPEFVALSQCDQVLTYRELNQQADLFADYLGECGVLPGETVALCLERSFAWVIAALGIMRAGAAYVPLDLSWPDSRLSYAVRDSHASVLVSRSELSDRLQIGIPCIDPFRDAATIARARTGSSSRTVAPESLAYVIYTSGSTGVPKGVEITHANLAHLTLWHRYAFHITRKDRVTHLAGLGFDAAAWELWPNLCAGATVLLAEEAVRSSAELLQQWIVAERATVSFVPTVHAVPLMSMPWPADTTLRCLLTGGDALQKGPPPGLPFEVVNNYGPTECSVVSTSGTVSSGGDQPPSIGRPVRGASIYLLDESGKPVPDGAAGEIYIGGGGVGRGYRNLDALTAQCFLPDRFSDLPGARMFRTGDRAARLPNGEMQFLGRLDRQVKIRGHRVELDEIGAVLSRHPGVAFATAMISFSKSGEAQLVGYVLPEKDICPPTTHDLQTYLLTCLPDYMVPSTIVMLKSLPLSVNGKLDLTALSASPGLHRRETAVSASSLSPTAAKLLTIVRQLLENEAVTAEDNFFLAGGHSLLGMQLLTRLQNAFGVTLTLHQLFEAPTAQDLAVSVERAQAETSLTAIWKEVLGLEAVGAGDDFFRLGGTPKLAGVLARRFATEFGREITVEDIHSNPTIRLQAVLAKRPARTSHSLPPGVVALRATGTRERIFWINQHGANLARVLGDDQPFFSVALTAMDLDSLGEAPDFKTMAACLLQKLRATQPAGPYIIGGTCLAGLLAYEVASQLQAAGEEMRLLVLVDPPEPSSVSGRGASVSTWTYFRHVVRKAKWLGPRGSILAFLQRLAVHFPRSWKRRFGIPESHAAFELLKAAVSSYQPQPYYGRALLLLPTDPSPLVEPFPRTFFATHLQTHFVGAYHGELMDELNSCKMAATIVSQLEAIADEKPSTHVSDQCGTNGHEAGGSATLDFALPSN